MAAPSPFGPMLGSNQFGAGSLSAGTSNLISAFGGLGNTRGTPVGRSSFDPNRMAEQAIRDARRKGNYAGAYQIGLMNSRFGQEQQQEQAGANALEQYFQQGMGQQPQGQPLAGANPLQPGWGNVGGDTGTREGNIAAVKQAGNFGAIVDSYNKLAQKSGKMMDANGNIVDIPANGGFTIPSANSPEDKQKLFQ